MALKQTVRSTRLVPMVVAGTLFLAAAGLASSTVSPTVASPSATSPAPASPTPTAAAPLSSDTQPAPQVDTTGGESGATHGAGDPGPASTGGLAEQPSSQEFDTVILGGRVMDPETGLDLVANIGVTDGTVQAITVEPLHGRTVIDATGLVVAPGFIDILSYDPNPYGIWYKIGDGVTTNLGMHGIITTDTTGWFERWEKTGTPANFGGAFSYMHARPRLGLGIYDAASPSQIDQLIAMAEGALQEGFMGIDMSLEYSPGISYEEVLAVARLAKRYNVPVLFHGRYSDMEEPGTNVDTLNEIIGAARETGAAVHVEHINSTGGTFSMRESLATLEAARREGLDVTACVYPYNFWGTYLGSARFDPGWQERFHIRYEDLEIAGTGERLTAETFAAYRKQNKLAVAYAIPEEDVVTALKSPFVMLGSDAIIERAQNNHPRGAGTFARALGRYVREEQVMTLMDALAKMTILPARRLEAQAPAMRRKGRLQVGSDADITVFDPETVGDRSTVREPSQFSAGIEWVLVGGEIVKDPEGVRRDVRPGRAIKSDFSNLAGVTP